MWGIYRTTKVYPQTIPSLSRLYYCQSTLIGPPSQYIHKKNISRNSLSSWIYILQQGILPKVISALTIFDATTSHIFGCPTRSKFTPLQIIETSIQFSRHNGYRSSILWVDKGVKNFHTRKIYETLHWKWSYCWNHWRTCLFNKWRSRTSLLNHQ